MIYLLLNVNVRCIHLLLCYTYFMYTNYYSHFINNCNLVLHPDTYMCIYKEHEFSSMEYFYVCKLPYT